MRKIDELRTVVINGIKEREKKKKLARNEDIRKEKLIEVCLCNEARKDWKSLLVKFEELSSLGINNYTYNDYHKETYYRNKLNALANSEGIKVTLSHLDEDEKGPGVTFLRFDWS